MTSIPKSRLLLMSFLVILVSSIGFSSLVHASSYESLNSLAEGETIDNDLFLAEQQVVIDQTINGDVFVFGNQIQVSGDVNGSIFVIGQNVQLLGKVRGTTYAAAITLQLGPEATLERNLYYIGGVLTAEEGAVIQRDLNTICLDAKISSQIGRNTNAMIGVINLISFVIQRLTDAGLFSMPSGQSLFLPSVGLGSANASLSPYLYQEPSASSSIDTAKLMEWLVERLRDFGLLLVLGAVLYWLFRKPLEGSNQMLRTRTLAALGYGFLALLIVSNLFLVGVLVAALIFVLGLWFGYLGLWSFTLAFWALAFASLAFIMAGLWFTVAYGTKLVIAYWIGTWLFEKLTPKTAIPHFVALAVGVLCFVLLRGIPMIGWVLGVIVTAWGLGSIWLTYYQSRRVSPGSELEETKTEAS
jgi:cytoskeletal protein CcmA (bactofilin family)